MTHPMKSFLKSWSWVILYVIFVYASLPILPSIWNKALEHFGKRLDYIPAILFFISGFVIIYYIAFHLGDRKVSSYAYLSLVFLAALLIFNKLELPVERIHIFEYGVLPFLIGPPLTKRRGLASDGQKSILIKILIIGFTIGIIDEIIQFFLPNRYCTISDILLNGISVALGLSVWRVFRPGATSAL
jgi:VanZ family protein